MPICGGINEQDKEATQEVHDLIKKVQESVHSKLNATFNVFEAVSYRTQVVAGRNYFIKVSILTSC